MTAKIQHIILKMSPHNRAATEAVLEGDVDTETLHQARREVAAYTDKIQGRNRGLGYRIGRDNIVAAGRAAYDEIAGILESRSAL